MTIPTAHSIRKGLLTVITGPMASGKSLHLACRLEVQKYRRRSFVIVKPQNDSRDGAYLYSRMLGEQKLPATFITHPKDLIEASKDKDVLAVDEVQFLSPELLPHLQMLMNQGVAVIACGLDTDFLGRPFGMMPDLLAMADEVIKLKAVCATCHQENATRTQLVVEAKTAHESWDDYQKRVQPIRDFLEGRSKALVGDIGMYQARCHQHHTMPELSSRLSD